MLASHNTSVSTSHSSEGTNSKKHKKNQKALINSYTELLGEKYQKRVKKLLNQHLDKLDPNPSKYIQPKIEMLKKTKLSVSQILDICTSNIKVISSREDKYWKQVRILIGLGLSGEKLRKLLLKVPSKRKMKSKSIKILSKKTKSH